MKKSSHSQILTAVFTLFLLTPTGPALAADGWLGQAVRRAAPEIAPSSPPPIPPPYVFTAKDADIVQCLTAACGNFEDNWSSDRSFSSRLLVSPRFQQVWDRVLQPAIRDSLIAEHENRRQTFLRMQALLNSGQATPKNHPAQALMQMIRLLTKHLSNVTDLIDKDAPMGVVRFDQERVKQLLASIPVETEKEATRLIANMLERGFQMASSDPFANQLEWRLKKLYPSQSRAAALKTDGAMILSQLSTLEKQAGDFFGSLALSSYEVAIFRKAASGRDLNPIESKIYLEATSGLDMLFTAATGEVYQALIKVPYDTEKELASLKSGALDRTLAIQNSVNLNERIQTVADSCKPLLNLAYNSALSVEQMRALESEINSVRGAARNVAKRLAQPAPGEDAIDKIFDQLLSFTLPENPRAQITTLHFRLHKNASRSKAFTAKIVGGNPDIDAALMILGPALASGELGQADEAQAVIQLCKQIPVPSLSDATLSAQGKIMLSWYTASYPGVGRGIIAHEIGHVISRALRAYESSRAGQARTFMESLACVANRNPFVTAPVSATSYLDTPWSEEDWADHFSALVTNEMKKSEPRKPTKNFACSLVNGYKDYSGNRLLPSAGDPHSSGFLRVLLLASDRGELPAQCQAFMNYAAETGRSLICK